jgi:hypothetical protein
MTTPSSTTDCALCIEGIMPAGVRDILGPVVTPCPNCSVTCDRCNGTAVYPAGYRCLHCFTADLAEDHGLVPVLCLGCEGVLALIPYPPTQEEATP